VFAMPVIHHVAAAAVFLWHVPAALVPAFVATAIMHAGISAVTMTVVILIVLIGATSITVSPITVSPIALILIAVILIAMTMGLRHHRSGRHPNDRRSDQQAQTRFHVALLLKRGLRIPGSELAGYRLSLVRFTVCRVDPGACTRDEDVA
jgi:hypothetical protein